MAVFVAGDEMNGARADYSCVCMCHNEIVINNCVELLLGRDWGHDAATELERRTTLVE
jgi:hypothetical protein